MTNQGFHSRRRATGQIKGHLNGKGCREARLDLDITQAELAEVAGISERSLRRFEMGTIRTRPVTVEALFGALGRFRQAALARLRGAA